MATCSDSLSGLNAIREGADPIHHATWDFMTRLVDDCGPGRPKCRRAPLLSVAQLTPATGRAGGVKKLHERFLDEASRALAESLDYEGTLKMVAQLAVFGIADWCTIDLLDADGQIVGAASEHRHLDHEHLMEGLRQHPPQHDAASGAPNVIRSGITEYVPRLSESLLRERESDPARLALLRRLRLNSTICAPLVARGRILGAITLSTSVGRQLTADDVEMAEELAWRAAIAIDNARLYADAQRAVRLREEILAIVTHDLRAPLSARGRSVVVDFEGFRGS